MHNFGYYNELGGLEVEYPLADTSIQQALEPGWLPEDADTWNNIYVLNETTVFFWMEDGPDNGDHFGRTGLFVFPIAGFKGGKGSAKGSGYFIDLNKNGWKLKLKMLEEGRTLSGVERVTF